MVKPFGIAMKPEKQIFDERDVIDFSQYMEETEHKHTVKDASIYVQGIIDHIHNPPPVRHSYMPWAKTKGRLQFRPGEVTVWGGENGVGKSLVTGQVALGLADQGLKVCIASFEMKPLKTLERMGRQFTGFNPHDQQIMGNDFEKGRMIEQYENFRDWTRGKLWLYDKQGTVRWPNVIAMAKYAARELRVQHVFVDNLGKCVQGEDDYNGQKEFVDQLCAVARDEDVHMHLVHHVKKPATNNAKPDKYAFKGTGAITDQPDNVIAVWRNRDERHIASETSADSQLIVCKQRNGDGWEGTIGLWYEKYSQQFLSEFGGTRLVFGGRQ